MSTAHSGFQETEEELQLVKDAILLPFMLTLIQRNKEKLDLEFGALKDLYMAAAELLMRRVHHDLVQVKKQMREKGIKLIEEQPSSSALRYRYISRGYEHRFDIIRSVAKAEMSTRLGEQVHKLINQLNGADDKHGKGTETTNKR